MRSTRTTRIRDGRRRGARRRGSIILWIGALLPALVGVVGLSVDAAWVILVAQQLQSSADAAALAGAQHVRTDQVDARTAAVAVAGLNSAGGSNVDLDPNSGNSVNGDIVLGVFDRATGIFTPTTTSPNAVRVFARRTSTSLNGQAPMIFGAVFGVTSIDVERSAIAMASGGGGVSETGVLILDEDASCGLSISGNGELDLAGGTIQVNSDHSCAACLNGNAEVTAEALSLVGEECFSGNAELNGTLVTGASIMDDPLEDLPEPPLGATQAAVPTSGNVTINPGYYPNGIVRSGNGTLTCNPGIYYIDGPAGQSCGAAKGLKFSGNARLIANGCMFFVKRGPVSMSGNVNAAIDSPTSGTYEKIAIFHARTNGCTVQLTGNNVLNLLGTIYVPNGTLHISGNGNLRCGWLIANLATFSGNGNVDVDFPSGTWSAGQPSVYLVE